MQQNLIFLNFRLLKKVFLIFSHFAILNLLLSGLVYSDDSNYFNANKLVQTELIFDRDIIQFRQGEKITAPKIGVLFKIEKGWHIYWKNPGESGKSTVVNFRLPENWKANELSWPTPIKYIEKGDIKTYAYKDEVLLFSELSPPPIVPNQDQELEFSAEVNFLVCNDRCIPGKISLSKSILASSIKPESPSNDFDKFKKYQAQTPKQVTSNQLETILTSKFFFDQNKKELVIKFKNEITNAILFETNKNFLTRSSKIAKNSESFILSHTFDIQDTKENILSGVLAYEKEGSLVSYEFSDLDLLKLINTTNKESGEAFNTFLTYTDHVTDQDSLDSNKTDTNSLMFYIFSALLGGIILNFMPCVLPVLSIKFFALINAKDKSKFENFRESLFFSIGVIASFMVLAAIFSIIKISGTSLGWGFQFQNPYFIFFMIVLLFFMALSFFDLLKIPHFSFSSIENAHQSTTNTDLKNILDGILVSILSTPCTAPFMGTAVAFALSQEIIILFLIFFFLALGLCLPFLLISTNQRMLSLMPKPGAWMQELKHFMGFGLVATIIWLISILENIVPGSIVYTLLCLFVLGVCLWIYKLTKSYTKLSKKTYLILFFGLILTIYFSYQEAQKLVDNKIEWYEFSESSLSESDRPIFIDFTADWCITCKYNENFVIDTKKVRQVIKEKNIKMLKADWTSGDEKITQIIKSFNAEGVPLYVLISSSGNKKVLNTILTKDYLINELSSID